MDKEWPGGTNVAEIRIARPTDKLEEIKKFYGDGLGLPVVGSFNGHEGYTGIMYGLPGRDYHLEFISHEKGSSCPAPTRDNLIVFYLPERSDIDKINSRLAAMGYKSVPPDNPYWKEKGITIEDPDGWRIILMNTKGI